ERAGDADILAEMENHPLGFHLSLTGVDMVLFHLEVGDAVTQQSACLGLALIDVDLMTDTGELLSGGKAGRAGPDDRDLPAGLVVGDLRSDAAPANGLAGAGRFDRLNRYGYLLEVQRAGLRARRGADAAGELEQIVGRVQIARGLFPVVIVADIVPVRD